MFLHLDEWPWLLNIYKARLLQICYVTCFCNVYEWIKSISCIYFDFLVVFTPFLRPCQLLYHVSWLLYYWSLQFFFLALTRGRPLPVTTFCLFEATLQPRSWFGNFLHRCNSAVYCSIMWYSFIHSSLQLKFMLMIYVLSHRIFSVLFSSSKNLAIFAWTFDPAFLLRSESLN